jgi:uncharacterized repeat protein (TIGR01451 family)
MILTAVFLTAVFLFIANPVRANSPLPVSEDFSAFTGTGFAPEPAAGQLDSDFWRVTGMSDGAGSFGGAHTTGDFARGSSAGTVSTGGIYAFDVGGGNIALGVQPGGSDFTPGEITLRVLNNSGSTVTDLDVAYTIWYNNDQGNASSFNFAYSADDASYTAVSALDFATLEAGDALGWQSITRTTTISGLSLADGASFYLQWQGDDAGAGGSRDELALDDVEVTISGSSTDTAPGVVSTTPDDGDTGVAVTTPVSVTFNEAVTISGTVGIDCTISGVQNVTPTTSDDLTFDLPHTDFTDGDVCTVTITGAQVADNDTDDPPDNMVADYSWSFTVGTPSVVLVINELLADPDAANGDANGDGVVSTTADEFVEIVNAGATAVDISGYTLSDATGQRHIFPSNSVVPAGCSVVLFAAGTPTGQFGGSVVQTATSGGLGLNNGGDTITLQDTISTTVAVYTYGAEGGNNQSLTRNPDVTGPEPLVQHSTITETNGALFSPGVKLDGTLFSGCTLPVPQLLLSEVRVTPTAGEFVEIYNPNGFAVDLSDVYLTDATFSGGGTYYYKIVTGILAQAGGGDFGDFHARFPDGATIAPGEYQTVALANSDNFSNTYGMQPTYELFDEVDGSPDAIPDMREALPGSINRQGSLSNDGEVAILYFWDGSSDLVTDLDYVVWGDKVEAVDKTGVSIDGPDADTDASSYLPDTAISSQDVVAIGSHQVTNSWLREDLAEGTETQSGGNGADGHNETSENLSITWCESNPLPNAANVCEAAPAVESTNPADGAINVAVDANVVVTFTEAVSVTAGWYDLSCDVSGAHTAVVSTTTNITYTLNPDADFDANDTCTLTIVAANVSDEDTADPPDTMEADVIVTFYTFTPPVSLVINEILADPGATTGDANGDGVINSSDDEFIELVNTSSDPLNISGWTLSDGIGVRHTFPAGTIIPGNCGIVIFGGGTPTGSFGNVLVQTASTGALGLNNTGDTITMTQGATPVLSYTYGAEGGNDQSLTRDPDVTGLDPLVEHTTAAGANGRLYSPGGTVTNFAFPGCTAATLGICGDPATAVHTVQGSGLASPLDGSVVVIEGVVVGDFQGATPTQLNAFFVQEEDSQVDGNPQTSEGIFVFEGGSAVDVAIGDVVRVRGTVDEYFDLTQLTSVSGVLVCGTDTATAATITLPVTDTNNLEWFEGMKVTLPQTLTVTNNYTWGRYGELGLATERLYQPTHIAEPGAPAQAVAAENRLKQIQLDDASSVQNPLPLPPYIGPGNTRLTGDTVTGLMGVLSFGFGMYEVHPVEEPVFARVNERTESPADVGGRLQVGSFNVLNYFVTLGSRGADNAFEFTRQRDKIIDAILDVDAAVLGLMEIENHATDDALDDLLDGLNSIAGPGTYAAVQTGVIGTDEIKVALIYQPALVTPVGDYAILDSTVDPRFDDTKNRPTLAQTFEEISSGARFTVLVNHLKSKGSDCDDVGDPDTGDGQGNCNLTRTNAVLAMIDWMATDPTSSGDPDFLVLGDLNSYALEDPIAAFLAEDFHNLLLDWGGVEAYSYQFQGQFGYLDYALANTALAAQVTGVTEWHINSDEPVALDYNDYNQPDLYVPDQFAASDHDPVIVGLDLTVATAVLEISKSVQPETDVAYHGTVTYTVTLANVGDALSGSTTLTDTLPVDVLFGSWVEQPAGADYADGQVSWEGELAPSGEVTLVFTAVHTGDYSQTITNTAWFASGDVTGNASATFTVEDEPVEPEYILYLPLLNNMPPPAANQEAPQDTSASGLFVWNNWLLWLDQSRKS